MSSHAHTEALHPITPKPGVLGTPALHPNRPKAGLLGTPALHPNKPKSRLVGDPGAPPQQAKSRLVGDPGAAPPKIQYKAAFLRRLLDRGFPVSGSLRGRGGVHTLPFSPYEDRTGAGWQGRAGSVKSEPFLVRGAGDLPAKYGGWVAGAETDHKEMCDSHKKR